MKRKSDYDSDSGYKKGKYGGGGGGGGGGGPPMDYRNPWEEEEDTSKYICPEEMRSVSHTEEKHFVNIRLNCSLQ